MFPTQAYVAQWDPLASAGFLEDRDSAVGYTAPPCYAPNPAPSSLLAIASDAATGALSFAWSRPLALPPAALAAGKFDVVADGVTPMTILGASSSDSAPAAARCDAFMQPHSLVQPGVAVVL